MIVINKVIPGSYEFVNDFGKQSASGLKFKELVKAIAKEYGESIDFYDAADQAKLDDYNQLKKILKEMIKE